MPHPGIQSEYERIKPHQDRRAAGPGPGIPEASSYRIYSGDGAVTTLYPELPSWHFNAREVSEGVYEVLALELSGRRVTARGADPIAVLDRCRQLARRLCDRSLPDVVDLGE